MLALASCKGCLGAVVLPRGLVAFAGADAAAALFALEFVERFGGIMADEKDKIRVRFRWKCDNGRYDDMYGTQWMWW
jgi:hypothetical protein